MINNQFNKELHNALLGACRDGIGGIILTNSDPEADYLALESKNRPILAKHSLVMNRTVRHLEDGFVHIILELIHILSGTYGRRSEYILERKHFRTFEEYSDAIFLMSRILYEGLLGIASSNDAIEAELFGPKRKYQEMPPFYDKKADYIYFEYWDNSGKVIKKIDRKAFERIYIGMTSEEESETVFEQPVRRELSWSDIKLFMQCKRCFFNAKKLGIKQPFPDPEGFALTRHVDGLLKKEFDQWRALRRRHPIMPMGLRPLNHKKLKKWQTAWSREDRRKYGIQFDNVWENWLVYGGVDDVWINENKEMVIVEYKTIAISIINHDFSNIQYLHEYKKQIDFYAWIFKKNNYTVSSAGYLLLCNALTNQESFHWNLRFKPYLVRHEINDEWVQPMIYEALKILQENLPPPISTNCKTCKFFNESTIKKITNSRL